MMRTLVLPAAAVLLHAGTADGSNTCNYWDGISQNECVGQGIPAGDWVSCGWCEDYDWGNGGVGHHCKNNLEGSGRCKGSWIRTLAPVNCVGSWGPYDSCSDLCGGGTQTRRYTVTRSAAHGGSPCEHSDGYEQTRSCNTYSCDVIVWVTAMVLLALVGAACRMASGRGAKSGGADTYAGYVPPQMEGQDSKV